jgi:HAD superfamily hydrolase (TIGR01509 family)
VTAGITHVVFDLGDVACRWLPDRRLVALAELSGLPPATIDQLVFESGFDDAGERGRFSLASFTDELAAMLGVARSPESAAALQAAWALAYEPLPSLLRAVRRLSTPTALLTNNGPLLEAALDAELSEVGDAFDQVLLSWRLGTAKPDVEAFERATAALGAAAGSVVFFDDSEANVAAAVAFGWQAHRFTTVLEVQATLARLGVA